MLVILGDAKCGKTRLLWRACLDSGGDVTVRYSQCPSVEQSIDDERGMAKTIIDGQPLDLPLLDPARQGSLTNKWCALMLAQTYKQASVFLICFSIAAADSLENVVERWLPHVRTYGPPVPIILVGCMKDLRGAHAKISPDVIDEAGKTVSRRSVASEEGALVARNINAFGYVECSARTGDGMQELYELAGRAMLLLRRDKQPRKCCTVA